MTLSTHLIYAGGTFGCHGTPLSPLPAQDFLPNFLSLLEHHAISLLPSDVIKDSSTLTPSDFVHFYRLITQAHEAGARQFILITGTDTLSFLGAFLANALAHLDISVFITGSMHPLFKPTCLPYTIDETSDAWHNISLCLTHMGKRGVFVALGDVFWANNTQKIHSQAPNAFVGTPLNEPAPTLSALTPTLLKDPIHAHIGTIYLTPNDPDVLAQQLQSTNAIAVILIAFGSGNVPSSPDVISALAHLHARGVPVVCTSMCAFGGVSSDYQAGAWQYAHGVWSGGNLTVAGVYGKLLWLYLTDNLIKEQWS